LVSVAAGFHLRGGKERKKGVSQSRHQGRAGSRKKKGERNKPEQHERRDREKGRGRKSNWSS
jgi:hypothetical protein